MIPSASSEVVRVSDGAADYELQVTDRGILRLPPRLRERYLTPQTDSALVQAVGHELRVWLWSGRSNVVVELPLDGYRVAAPYERTLRSWGIDVNRWLTPGAYNDQRRDVDPLLNGQLVVDEQQGQRNTIMASVREFEGVKPDA